MSNIAAEFAPSGTRYPGGKGGAGVYQKIIGLMPPHQTYIEPFVGGGAVLRHKAPASCSIVIDRDARVHKRWSTIAASNDSAGGNTFTAIHGDGIQFMRHYAFEGSELVYCDPPYVMSTKRGGELYKHEMTNRQHPYPTGRHFETLIFHHEIQE